MKIAFGDQCRAQRFGGNNTWFQLHKVRYDACHLQPHSVSMLCIWNSLMTNFMLCFAYQLKWEKKENKLSDYFFLWQPRILKFIVTKVDKTWHNFLYPMLFIENKNKKKLSMSCQNKMLWGSFDQLILWWQIDRHWAYMGLFVEIRPVVAPTTATWFLSVYKSWLMFFLSCAGQFLTANRH